jgi:hypothetical protein
MAALSSQDQDLRGALTRLIAREGNAPSIADLAKECLLTPSEAQAGLRRLADAHALLLHPDSDEPWAVHPFALAPGSCWVEAGGRGYWANCLYCAFGIAAALKCDATITTRYGGEADTVRYRVEHNSVAPCADLFHLSTPPRKWWDNVIFACSSFQPFRNRQEIEDWVDRHRLPQGAVMTIPQLWAFAQEWYGEYLATPWRKRTPDEASDLFRRHNLTGAFWAFD